jgi:hypothetical protein
MRGTGKMFHAIRRFLLAPLSKPESASREPYCRPGRTYFWRRVFNAPPQAMT